jgi:hypothetical protein
LVLLGGLFFFALSSQRPAYAGGPLLVGGAPQGFGPDAQPFVWAIMPITYTTDQGGLGGLSNDQANTRVGTMFQVWEGVTTATISYTRAASNLSFDVVTESDFNQVEGDCGGFGNPIVYDVDGMLFDALGIDPNVIGFAGPCTFNSAGEFTSGRVAMNGKWIDGDPSNGETTNEEYNAALIHEIGHFSGLDHSQINVNCLGGCGVDDLEGLPTMFPFLFSDEQRTLSPDDIAWISSLYPDSTFVTTFGAIEGTIFFSDGQTPAQGVNVIARQVSDGDPANGDESRRIAVSVVSGYLFTGNPGQSVTGTNFGSSLGSREPQWVGIFRIPGLPPGDYTVEVEELNAAFVDGSSVGPLGQGFPFGAGQQFSLPGPPEFWDVLESSTDLPTDSSPVTIVMAGDVVMAIDIILNGTPPRFDQFEN